MAAVISAQDHTDLESSETISRMLRKPRNMVYETSPDGQRYTSPQCLNDTPTGKITEDGAYWKTGWSSLEAFFAQEEHEEDAKREAHELLKIKPSDKDAATAYKVHSDNVSKHRRIRDIFGSKTSYHPNQLVSKHHLPQEGLCHKEVMYRLACKISDLRVLHEKHELAMDPWNFIRWRIIKKMQSFLTFSAQSGRGEIKRIILNICDDSGPNGNSRKYEDPLLRAAIIRSAGYQNRLASFNTNGNKSKKTGRKGSATHERTPSVHRSKTEPLKTTIWRSGPAPRVEKREKRASRPSKYQGVNAYRAQQKFRDTQKDGDSGNRV
ncbi:hypothetical protein FSARC_10289 [Fusarium sarcochroum]|uniref:Uncharacterized protein n=1 Tax=Fusarium sarcochroum TaxID=1208366 RepID=A0A8H4X4F8_9HYPO|nr:hypothetical protein FSARC_10289 [Fusarium sarcochroum]